MLDGRRSVELGDGFGDEGDSVDRFSELFNLVSRLVYIYIQYIYI